MKKLWEKITPKKIAEIWFVLWAVSVILVKLFPMPYSDFFGIFMFDAAFLFLVTVIVLGTYTLDYCSPHPPGASTADLYLNYLSPFVVILISVIFLLVLVREYRRKNTSRMWTLALILTVIELLGAISTLYIYFCYPIPYFRLN